MSKHDTRSSVWRAALIAVAAGVAAAAPAWVVHADSITFVGNLAAPASPGGDDNTIDLSAFAIFELTGTGLLQITLTNDSADPAGVPSDSMTGLFFAMNGGPDLTPLSAILNDGSVVLNRSTQPAGGNVGGEFAYRQGVSLPGGATRGISSAGFDDVFGIANFNGPNLAPPPNGAVNGMEYGIVSSLSPDASNPHMVLGSGQQFIANSVVFLLTPSSPITAPLSELISNVSFQFGTGRSQPNVPGTPPVIPPPGDDPPQDPDVIPEPASFVLLGMGVLGLSIRRFRRRMY